MTCLYNQHTSPAQAVLLRCCSSSTVVLGAVSSPTPVAAAAAPGAASSPTPAVAKAGKVRNAAMQAPLVVLYKV